MFKGFNPNDARKPIRLTVNRKLPDCSLDARDDVPFATWCADIDVDDDNDDAVNAF
jgi:hypothetical protein